MKTIRTALALSLCLAACGAPEVSDPGPADPVDVQAAAACSAYLLDLPSFSGPLPPFPVSGAVGQCITLPAGSQFRTSSFRLAGCRVFFFDHASCGGTSYTALTSGVMPPAFDNRAVSLRFF